MVALTRDNQKQCSTDELPADIARPTLLEAALTYAGRGWHVFPVHSVVEDAEGEWVCTCSKGADCGSPGKHPHTEHGFQDATAEEQTIRGWWTRWPTANVGIACGASGLVVLDVDPRQGGDATLEARTEEHGKLPETLTVNTGGGGQHYYFADGTPATPDGKAGAGLDRKAATGYVVAPPSRHASGGTYSWVEYDAEPVAPPTWVLQGATRAAEATERRVADALHGIPEGDRNHALFRLASRHIGKGLTRDEVEALALVAAANCTPPLPADEALGVVKSAWERHGRAEPSLRLETFTLADLRRENVKPTRWLVPGILPEGMTVLAGKSKSGKSFLAQQLAISVAEGKDVCGFLAVEEFQTLGSSPYAEEGLGPSISRGDVLYAELEMSKQVIQERASAVVPFYTLRSKGASASGRGVNLELTPLPLPDRLFFTLEAPRLGEGFEEALELWLGEHPDAALVVIDLLARIRNPERGRGNAYEADYAQLAPLQQIAKRRRIALLVVHHTRKRGAGESAGADVESVSGSMGITGAADAVLLLTSPEKGRGRLQTTGRAGPPADIDLEFTEGVWRVTDPVEAELTLGETRRAVLDCLIDDDVEGVGLSAKEVAKNTELKEVTAKTHLGRLKRAGLARNEKGRWFATERATPA